MKILFHKFPQLAVLAALLTIAPLGIAKAQDTLRISLKEAVVQGLGQGEELQVAESQVAEAISQVRQARSGLFPKIDFGFNYTRALRTPFSTESTGGTSLPPFDPDPAAPLEDRISYLENNVVNAGLEGIANLFSSFPIGQKNTWTARFTIDQTLFDGSVFVGVRAAKTFLSAAEAQADEQAGGVALQIVETYLSAQLASDLLRITDSTVALLDSQLAQARQLRNAGNASELDVLRLEVQRDNLDPQRVAAQNQREVAMLDLRRLLNIEKDAPLVLTDDLSPEAFTPASSSEIAALVNGAPRNRAALEVSRQQVVLQEQQVRADKASRLPTLSANAAFGKQALPEAFFPSGDDWRDDWSLGVAFKLPLFNGFSTSARIDQSRELLTQAKLNLAQQEEAVSIDVEQQRGELDRAATLIAARSRNVERAERVYQLADLSYRQGVSTSLDLQDARLSLSQARVDEAQAQYDYRIALARLRRAAGATVIPGVSERAGANSSASSMQGIN